MIDMPEKIYVSNCCEKGLLVKLSDGQGTYSYTRSDIVAAKDAEIAALHGTINSQRETHEQLIKRISKLQRTVVDLADDAERAAQLFGVAIPALRRNQDTIEAARKALGVKP